MKWGEEQGTSRLAPHPHEEARMRRKEQVVTPEQYAALLAQYKDQNFKDLLTSPWETGCRPQSRLRVEARHVDLPGNRWFFPASGVQGQEDSAHRLSDPTATGDHETLDGEATTGPLFRIRDGCPDAVCDQLPVFRR